jgi:hypothetical protein
MATCIREKKYWFSMTDADHRSVTILWELCDRVTRLHSMKFYLNHVHNSKTGYLSSVHIHLATLSFLITVNFMVYFAFKTQQKREFPTMRWSLYFIGFCIA